MVTGILMSLAIAHNYNFNDLFGGGAMNARDQFLGRANRHFIKFGNDIAFLDPKQVGRPILAVPSLV